ncbi:hypothetical protein [Nostoc sp.]
MHQVNLLCCWLKNGRCCRAIAFMTLHQGQLPDPSRHLTLCK